MFDLCLSLNCCNSAIETEWLKKQLLLILLAAGRSKIKVLVDSVPDGGPLTGLQTAVFLLCPHIVEKE